MTCKVCADAIVIHKKTRLHYVAIESGKRRDVHETQYTEAKWERGESWQEINISGNKLDRWPGEVAEIDSIKVKNLMAYSDQDRNQNEVWGGILTRDFVGRQANRLLDMVSGGSRSGYVLQSVKWGSEDRSSMIVYEFASADYGTTTVTFARVNDKWMPVRLLLVKTGNHKLSPDTPDHVRLKDDGPISDFTPPAPGLDRRETDLEISYDKLPTSIKSTLTRTFRSEKSVLTNTLVFQELQSGAVLCDEVRQAMLPIADGTNVLLASADGANVQWTTKDGKIIKTADVDAIRIGRYVVFSSTRQVGILVTSIVVAALAAAVLLRRIAAARRAG